VEFQPFIGEYVKRLTERDVDTERHFVAHFSELLLIKLRKVLRSKQVIEDVRQETFLRVFAALRNKRE
jgi:RNA polymerase sigma-70 factor, ECF subfamily